MRLKKRFFVWQISPYSTVYATRGDAISRMKKSAENNPGADYVMLEMKQYARGGTIRPVVRVKVKVMPITG